MRILFLTDNFPPEVNAPATRTYEHARAWLARGAEVTVVTSAPNFPQGKLYPGYRNRWRQVEMVDGIRVVRVWSYMTANEGFARRVVDYMSYAAMAFAVGLTERADVIIATSPQFFTTWAGWALSKLRGLPWIFELRDLWPESLAAVGAARNDRLLRLLERIELGLYRSASRVVAVTPAFRTNLLRRGIADGKVSVITNGVDLAKYQPRERDDLLAAEWGLGGKKVIGYLGTHGMAHGLDFILRAAMNVRNPDVRFLFVGDGAEKARLAALVEQLGLANVVMRPPVPKEEVARVLSIFDVALVPLRRSDTFKTVIPSKIFEAASMRKPLLLGVEGQAQEIVELFDAGVCFVPEDEGSFLQAVDALTSDPELYARLQDGCDGLARAYDRSALADDMLTIIEEVVGARSR